MKLPFLSVIIPAYNESTNIISTVNEILEYFKNHQAQDHEIIVVDDGSTDGTTDLVEKILTENNRIRLLINDKNRGKGFSVRRGVLEAAGSYILFMDADNSTPITEIEKLFPYFDKGFDSVIASRKVPGREIALKAPFYRIILGQIYILFSKIILGSGVKDYNCGFKIYKASVAKQIFSKQLMEDWSFDAELIFLLEKYGYKIKEVPVIWRYRGTSKVRPIRDGIKSFCSLILIRRNDALGRYEE